MRLSVCLSVCPSVSLTVCLSVRVRVPEGAVGAGGGRGLPGRRRDGALVLLAQRVHGRLVVGAAGAAVVGRGLVADGAQAGAGGTHTGADAEETVVKGDVSYHQV